MGVVLFPKEYSVVLGDIFNFHNVGMREIMLLASSMWPEMLVNMLQCTEQCPAPPSSPPNNEELFGPKCQCFVVEKFFSVEKFCSNIYQTLSYFNISEFNIICLNSDLHSLLMCRYQKTLFFFQVFCKAEMFPQCVTCSYCQFHSFPQHNIYCLMVSMVKGLSVVCLDYFFACSWHFENISKNETAKVKSNIVFPLFLLFIFSYKKYMACHGI